MTVAEVITFPRRFRHLLPLDAKPCRDRHCVVFPHDGAWGYVMSDDWGGAAEFGLTRNEAIAAVEEWVIESYATLEIRCSDYYDDDFGEVAR